MAKTFRFELVTPEKAQGAFEAEFAAIPAHEGEMGVLPGHESYLAMLKPGEVRVTVPGGGVRRYAVSGGFAEVTPKGVDLFAETAEMADEIDAERARAALERSKAELARKTLDPMTLAQAEAAFQRAAIRLKVAELARRPGRKPSR